ncbi:MAG TPA: ATP-binding protein [Candidatus Lokiarchaeia archaeon]|nr:ATP-binding protein [Candidatus Lokiarchaeia archaeon]
MQQAFLNIIINAQQAMPEGGFLEITAVKNDAMVEIAFKDTGVGISSDNLPKLFELLFSTKTKGFGLGLVITKEIVERHEGTIEVKSEVGIGTTFTIKLPVRENKIVVAKLTESFW